MPPDMTDPKPPETGSIDPVDAFMAAHPDPIPEGAPVPPQDDKPAADVRSAIEEPKPPVVGEKPAPSGEVKPGETTPPPAKPTAEQPSAEKPAGEQPAGEKPAVQPRTYAGDEKIALAEGNEWTRDQIVAGLRIAETLKPAAAESQRFQKVFGMTAEQADKEWTPLIARLGKEPQMLRLFEDAFSNTDKAEYLFRASRNYDEWVAENGGQPAKDEKPAETHSGLSDQDRQEIEGLKTFRQQSLRDAADRRLNSEWNAATQQFPFLLHDDATKRALAQLAMQLHAEDIKAGIPESRCRGLAAAVEMNKANFAARMVVYESSARDAAAAKPEDGKPAGERTALLGATATEPAGARKPKQKVYEGTPDQVLEKFFVDPPPEFTR